MENFPLEEEVKSSHAFNFALEEEEEEEKNGNLKTNLNKIETNNEQNNNIETNNNIININFDSINSDNIKTNNDINDNLIKNNLQSQNEDNKEIEEGNLNINQEIKNIKTKENIEKKEQKEQKEKKEKKEKSKYIEEAKKYINYNVKDTSYTDIISNEPNSLFQTLEESTIMKWEIKLFNNFSYTKTTSDEMITSVEKNTPFQSVIRNDAVRTRVRESVLVQNFKETLEKMMTYYCKVKQVYYKQGLNEIFGPLILMKFKIKSLKLSKIFLWGDLFIDRFLPNYFYEKDFYSLKSSLGLFVILLKYHEPSVFNRLDKMEILPEMYATNWIMTLMSGKVKLDILFVLWDYIIEHDDPLFIHYFLVSLFIHKRELIINCDKSLLPPLISNLTIFTKEELKIIVDMADELKKHTPYSFRVLANHLGFLIPKYPKLKEKYETYKPQSIPAMPIFPQEIFYINYNNRIKCPDPDCDNEKGFKKIIKNGKVKYKLDFGLLDNPDAYDYGEKMKEHICEKCNLKVEKDLNFILIDLRLSENGFNKEESNDKIGILPQMINLEPEELRSEDLNEILADKYIQDRGKYHFIFITNTTDTFSKFESKFYKDNITEQDKMKMLYGLMEPQKVDKELDVHAGNLSFKEMYKLKEYDNLRKTLKSMQKQNYPYISYAYGGFYNIHENSLKNRIELLSHVPENCMFCLEKKEKEKNKKIDPKKEEEDKNNLYKFLWAHKKKIKYRNLTEYFNDPKISISFGSLIEYKGQSLHYEKIQILIAILFPQFKIEIYKFDIKRQHNLDKSNYYDLGINDEEQKDRDLIILEELKVSDIVGMSVDKKTKNLLNLSIKIKDSQKNDKKKKNDNIKYDSYNMIVDLSSSKDAKEFFRSFKKMSDEYKNYYKNKMENKK